MSQQNGGATGGQNVNSSHMAQQTKISSAFRITTSEIESLLFKKSVSCLSQCIKKRVNNLHQHWLEVTYLYLFRFQRKKNVDKTARPRAWIGITTKTNS